VSLWRSPFRQLSLRSLRAREPSNREIAREEIARGRRLFLVDLGTTRSDGKNGRHKLRLLVSNEGVLPTYLSSTRRIARDNPAAARHGRARKSAVSSPRFDVSAVFTIPFHLTVPMAISTGKKDPRPPGKSEIHARLSHFFSRFSSDRWTIASRSRDNVSRHRALLLIG